MEKRVNEDFHNEDGELNVLDVVVLVNWVLYP